MTQDRRWAHLVAGLPLERDTNALVAGRVDLRGFRLPAPQPRRRFLFGSTTVRELAGLVVVRGGRWSRIDFSGAHLPSLRFFDTIIEDCVFDGADCRDWRIWTSEVRGTTFRGADLHGAALGGIAEEKRNTFVDVDFTRADLRETAYETALFQRCTFSDARLRGVDFNGTVFVDCVFSGELEDVSFARMPFGRTTFPPNGLVGVDFSRARLRSVEFRELDLKGVKLPNDDEHLVIDDYPAALDRALEVLKNRSDSDSRGLAAYLAVSRRWAPAGVSRGVLNRLDLVEAGGPAVAADVLKALTAG